MTLWSVTNLLYLKLSKSLFGTQSSYYSLWTLPWTLLNRYLMAGRSRFTPCCDLLMVKAWDLFSSPAFYKLYRKMDEICIHRFMFMAALRLSNNSVVFNFPDTDVQRLENYSRFPRGNGHRTKGKRLLHTLPMAYERCASNLSQWSSPSSLQKHLGA